MSVFCDWTSHSEFAGLSPFVLPATDMGAGEGRRGRLHATPAVGTPQLGKQRLAEVPAVPGVTDSGSGCRRP